jgi:hypothetical protein
LIAPVVNCRSKKIPQYFANLQIRPFEGQHPIQGTMTRQQNFAFWTGVAVLVAALMLVMKHFRQQQPVTLTGVVIQQDSDPRKQHPLADVDIVASDGTALSPSKSDASGLFHLHLRPGVKPGQSLSLTFRHPEYKPLHLDQQFGDLLYVVRMSPLHPDAAPAPSGPMRSIAQVSIRYSVKASTSVDVGSALKTFEVVNTANVECRNQQPCSPDNRWKATVSAFSLDAGTGNRFRNPRVSCIAGPCPFTTVDSEGLEENGRVFKVSVRNWSDPATFLVEAEVVQPTTADLVRESFPAILGRNLNFTLPAEADSVSIQAEIDGSPIVFPLGPELCLSWAQCSAKTEKDQATTYQCELKPGFEFR